MKKTPAVAYFRTSSATNVGADKDSLQRQRDAVAAYAKTHGLSIVREFYDAAVSGADAVDIKPAFVEMLAYCQNGGPKVILVETANRFSRDLLVQLTGHDMLQRAGVELIPVDAPTYFSDPSPTAELVRQVLGAVSQYQKAELVAKLRHARDKKRAETGRCEGRTPVPAEVVKEAKRLARVNPKTGERRSLRQIADELAKLGHTGPSGKPYYPTSVKLMIG